MSDLDALLNDFIMLADSGRKNKGTWREYPVDLLTFFKSEEYLNEEPYPGKQTELLEATNKILWYKMTGNESLCPENLRKITEMTVMFGKGSGKDFLASGILAYVCYLLCCMNDPHEYFGFGQDEPIDIVNVAINAYQATNVFFKKLKARFNNCKWFKKTMKEPTLANEYQVTRNQIRFYKNITAHSAHSESESYEGFNPLIVIFDEIGGFTDEDAETCYSTFRSSATSRYNEKILLIFISYPRAEQTFYYKKYEEGKNDPEVYSMLGKSWEVNPKIKRASLEKEYKRDPETAKLKFECIPPKYSSNLFSFPERIDECIQVGKFAQCKSLIVQEKITTRTLNTGVQRHFIGLELFNLALNPQYVYYLGGDGGVQTDSYVISLFHAEPTVVEVVENNELVERWFNKPVEDLILQWQPSKAERLPVDLLNVSETIEAICKQVFVKKALFDTFNSAEVMQKLMVYGVEAEDKTFSNPFQLQIYSNFKGLVYTNMIELLDHTVYSEKLNANEELKFLKLINGNKIDHDRDKGKDFSDARASAIWICSMDEPALVNNFAMPVIVGASMKR